MKKVLKKGISLLKKKNKKNTCIWPNVDFDMYATVHTYIDMHIYQLVFGKDIDHMRAKAPSRIESKSIHVPKKIFNESKYNFCLLSNLIGKKEQILPERYETN